MKFKLETTVNYKGQSAKVHDYSHRYKTYTLIIEGKRVYDVKEQEIC
jgi:hypothetical protein